MIEIALKVDKFYSDNFHAEPAVYYSPGRINLIGEHVDYNDGFVMPAAIDKGVYFAIAKNDSEEINFYSIDYEEWLTLDVTEVRKMDGWKNYVLSVVNEFKIAGHKIHGFDCVFGGNIPPGAGMSSSAAVEGGLAVGLNEIFECGYDRTELALLCQRAEHNYPAVKCGIMDQYANMNGKRDHVILLDCMKLEHEYFPIKMDGYSIVLIDSKAEHSLGDGEYNKRRKECEEALQIMKAKSFRDLKKSDLEDYRQSMHENVYNSALYVVEEIARTQQAAEYLKSGKLQDFGKLMFETHEGLSKLYHVSSEELDFLVGEAKENGHVIGSRLMGAGFGGCTINIVETKSVESFIERTLAAYKAKFNIEGESYQVEIVDGVKQIYLGQ